MFHRKSSDFLKCFVTMAQVYTLIIGNPLYYFTTFMAELYASETPCFITTEKLSPNLHSILKGPYLSYLLDFTIKGQFNKALLRIQYYLCYKKKNSGNWPRSTLVPLLLSELFLKLNVTPEHSTDLLPSTPKQELAPQMEASIRQRLLFVITTGLSKKMLKPQKQTSSDSIHTEENFPVFEQIEFQLLLSKRLI